MTQGILEFLRLKILLTPRKSRIPKTKSRILRDCFASLAMTRALEFPIEILGSSPRMTQKAKPEDGIVGEF